MIRIVETLEKADYVTHAGNFHADDVFSAVFLEHYFGDITLIRLKDYQDDGKKLAFDIGLGKFDHHQINAKKREDGITYCGFGILWKEYGLSYLKKINVKNPQDVFQVFDYLLVENIDAFDNGEFSIKSDFNIYNIPGLIEIFRPRSEQEEENECFLKATEFASFLFDKILEEAIYKVENIVKIKKIASTIKNKILILDEYIPYEYALFYLNLDVDFVIYPSNRGGYAAHTVPSYYKGFTPKVPFLKEWGGLRNEELAQVSGVASAKFCHTKLFLATADTLEDAKLLVTKTIEKNC